MGKNSELNIVATYKEQYKSTNIPDLINKSGGYKKWVIDGIPQTPKESEALERFIEKYSSLSNEEYIRKYRQIKIIGYSEGTLNTTLSISAISQDIIRFEKILTASGNSVEKINNLISKNLITNHSQLVKIADELLPAFKQQSIGNLKPRYFNNPDRVFDEINMIHILDKHTVEHFNFGNIDGKDIDMFEIGTSQQSICEYIDEALTILKENKGPDYPKNGFPETVKLRSNEMTVIIGSLPGDKILTNNSFTADQNVIGMFYPVKGSVRSITIEPSYLKILKEILQ